MLRASTAGAIGKALYNELRLQWRGDARRLLAPTSAAPAVLVLNAFNTGGAQLAGARGTSLFTLADDLDIAIGRHAIRTGFSSTPAATGPTSSATPAARSRSPASTITRRRGRRHSRATSAIHG